MKIDIKNRWNGSVMITVDVPDELKERPWSVQLGEAVKIEVGRSANLRSADLSSANLSYANLSYANLGSADLSSANLRYANLSYADLRSAITSDGTVMPNGDTWKDYISTVLPALLTAGGKDLSEVATAEHWECHSWSNCPMSAAFGVHEEKDTPALLRPRVREFVQLFDARLIKLQDVLGTGTA